MDQGPIRKLLESSGKTPSQLHELLSRFAGPEHGQRLTVQAFANLLFALGVATHHTDIEQVFKAHDEDGDGYVSFEELLQHLGEDKESKSNAAVSFITDAEGDWEYFASVVAQDPVLRLTEGDELEWMEDHAHDGMLVYGGDSVDKRNGDKRLVKALTGLHDKYPGRVILLLGNRDLNKMRFQKELHRDPDDMATLPNKWLVSRACYWDVKAWNSRLSPEERKESPEPNSYPAFLERLKLAHGWVSILKWMLEHTMGAAAAFEERRDALSKELGVDAAEKVSDKAVYRDFYDSMDPASEDPWMLAYLQRGILATTIGCAAYLHGGLTEANLGKVPDCPNLEFTGTLQHWFGRLNEWVRDRVDAFAKQPKQAYVGDLLDYSLPLLSKDCPRAFDTGLSIVTSNWLKGGNNKPLDQNVVDMCLRSGIRFVFTGHQPHGDCPSLIRSSAGVIAAGCDTSYSDGMQRRKAASAVTFFAGEGRTAVVGVLASKEVHSYSVHWDSSKDGDTAALLGRQLKDGYWLKTLLPDGSFKAVLGEGYKQHNKVLSLEEAQDLLLA